MLHYTLNTAHTRESPRSEVSDDVIETLAPLLLAGKHDMPIEGYWVAVTTAEFNRGLLFTVYRGDAPLVTTGVAPDDGAAEELWPQLERLYLAIGDLPGIRSADFAASRRPDRTPWCAGVLIGADAREAYWLADFERCLAWAWLEGLRK